MDAEFYTENILKDTLLPFVRSGFPEGHSFIQDNDPKHKSKKAKQFMQDNAGSTGCRRGRQVRTVCD